MGVVSIGHWGKELMLLWIVSGLTNRCYIFSRRWVLVVVDCLGGLNQIVDVGVWEAFTMIGRY